MKKITLSYLLSIVAVIVLLGSCGGLKKMQERASEIKYTVTPSPLEMHADKVAVKVEGKIPPKYFDKKALLVISPVLKYGDKTYALDTWGLRGEDYANNYQEIKYKEGGSFRFDAIIPYVDGMMMSDFEMSAQASRGDKKAEPFEMPLAKGVIATPRLVKKGGLAKFIEIEAKMDAKITDLKTATILYALQKSNINRKELKKEELAELIKLLTETTDTSETELVNVEIASYASPDGPEDLNAKLVEGRGKAAQGYVEKSLKKSEASVTKKADFLVKATTPTEDWDGFKKAVDESEVQDKDLILRVLTMYSDPVVREREIKNISEAYTDLKDDVLPQLRRSVIKANYQSKVKTNDELLKLAADSMINTLQLKELLYTATLTEDLAKKEEIYKVAIAQHADCYVAHNNLGVALANQNKLDEAKASFENAVAKKADLAPAIANLGAVALSQGNYEEAKKYFTEAKNANCNSEHLGDNMAVIDIMNGDYSKAIANCKTNSFNKALAQTLNKQNAAAETTLNAMGDNDNGWFYYLKAVVAAKDGKDDAVFTNLKTAFEKAADSKAYAKKDMEFQKYFENDTFKTLVE